ncbi:HAD family hydrolase [Thalassotalea aquiviva]|uniref:sulfotransferase-like domain-containing protein n=1 Tax=Thalassotalea aquiviva TaxID=3242415 RepID=UPI00352A24DF
MTRRIAMWSGPRNISTAMMRAWENRPDTDVIDEPFYAYYLAQTQAEHPVKEDVLAAQPNHWSDVVSQLLAPKPEHIFYQKHMTHHMLDDIELDWCKSLSHCFLIRDPLYVVTSYLKKMPSVNLEDIGIVRQFKLYQHLSVLTGQQIPIIDGDDVLQNPKAILSSLCAKLELPFSNNMLSWPQGRRESDGVWAQHWYQNVESSTGFKAPARAESKQQLLAHLTSQQQDVVQISQVFYQQMYQQRLHVDE